MSGFPPIDVGKLAEILGGARCVVYDRVSSTLDVLDALAEEHAPHGTVVIAEEQLAGRGRHGRDWHSPVGGLWFAFLNRPVSVPETGTMALRTALVVTRGLRSLVGDPSTLAIKWPNDVMLGDRKAGGILCEAKWQGAELRWIGVGIGLNLINEADDEFAADVAHLDIGSRTAVLEAVLPGLVAMREAPPALTPAELERVATMDWLLGRTLAAPVPGVAAGIDALGGLRVAQKDEVRTVLDGTVLLAE